MHYIVIFIIVYWLLNRKKALKFRCKHCKKTFKEDSEYCPKCKLNNEGLTVIETRIIILEQKFNRFEEFTEMLKEKLKNGKH